jgi:hypothetical protein
MVAWRVLGALGCVLAAAPAARPQSVDLGEAVKPGDCFRVRLRLAVKGDLLVLKEGTRLPLPLEVAAAHDYSERVLSAGGPGADKVARLYGAASSSVKIGGAKSERSLRPERRLCVAQRFKDQPLTYSPAGALTRDELDLTTHLDTPALPGLLPGKAVAVGGTWRPADAAVLAVCGFEALSKHDLAGKLESVKDGVAVFSVKGPVEGIDAGAIVKLTVEATGKFDVAGKRIVGLEWGQKDERDQGPVSPAWATQTTWAVERSATPTAAGLEDVALVSIPPSFEPPASMVQLDFREPGGHYALLHERDWHHVAQTGEHGVFRLMDRGDFVAQATVTVWTKADKGGHLSPEQFKAALAKTPGWEPENELQAGEIKAEGRYAYRLSVLGKLDGVAVLQNFYLVATPDGEQVVVTFTLTPKQADKLGARDLAFVAALEIPAPK